MATEKTDSASTDEATISLQRSLYDPGYVNAMSHFYRGEMGRIMVWRQRLDITTNWAITSSTAIITIAFFSDRYSRIELREMVDRLAIQRIQTVPGIGSVWIATKGSPACVRPTILAPSWLASARFSPAWS